ncbi:MAG: PucR family transcriptional regulator ligand-binding domain-containing protein, partial [Candidatus Dormibacteraceae bacterium]
MPDPSPAHLPTVGEAMEFGGLAKAELVAGAEGLDHRIRWVRVMETPDTVRRIGPQELLLTTTFPIRDDRSAQIALIIEMAAIGGAGVVIKLGRYLDQLPPEMAEEANRLKLPLFTISAEVPWIELIDPLIERIINIEHWQLKRSLEIRRRFTDLILDGKGVDEICYALAEMLESGVSVEDASFQLLAHAGNSNQDPHRQETISQQGTPARVRFDPQIQKMLREVEAHRLPTKIPAFPHLGMRRERIIAPMIASNQVLGYISVLDHPPRNEELALTAVEQAALVVTLALIQEREVAMVEASISGEYLEDLLQGSYGDLTAAKRRARHIGYPLIGQHALLIAEIDNLEAFIKVRQLGEEGIQSLKQELRRRLNALL